MALFIIALNFVEYNLTIGYSEELVMTRLTAEVPYEMAGMRLDQILAELFADYSRSKLQTWVKAGRVQVNNLTLKPKDKLEGGELITLDAEAEVVVTSEAEEIPLEIVLRVLCLLFMPYLLVY